MLQNNSDCEANINDSLFQNLNDDKKDHSDQSQPSSRQTPRMFTRLQEKFSNIFDNNVHLIEADQLIIIQNSKLELMRKFQIFCMLSNFIYQLPEIGAMS